MNIYSAGMEPFFGKRLAKREVELRQLIHPSTEVMRETDPAGSRGVVDLKDAAFEQASASVDEARVDHAVRELEEVLAARGRLADHEFGLCADCGEAIDLSRLMTLVATPCCTACQAVREAGEGTRLRAARVVVAIPSVPDHLGRYI